MKKIVIIMALSSILGISNSLESYTFSITNSLDTKSPYAQDFKNLDLEVYIEKASCVVNPREKAVTITPRSTKKWDMGGCCLDHLVCSYTEADGTKQTIETRPSWSASKFDRLPTTGVGLACRDVAVEVVFDAEGALSLQQI